MFKILLIVLVVALVSVGYYFRSKNKLFVPSEVVILDVSNWKTYRNEKNGLEFKYPSDFTVEKDSTLAFSGGLTEDAFVYNFRHEFYPEYRSGTGFSRPLTRYYNFGLLFHPNSISAESFGGSYGLHVENVKIGPVAYEKMQQDKNRRETYYFLRYPQRDKYIQIIYRPTIDKRDIGGLSVQPDYVSGLEAVRKDSRFLDYQEQIEILNSILSSVKLF